MAKSLEALVKERIKEAKKKKISDKAESITAYLGKKIYDKWFADGVPLENNKFKDNIFEVKHCIFLDPYRDNTGYKTEIRYKSDIVFLERGYYGIIFKTRSVDSYIPGAWEIEFNSLYERAREAGKLIAEHKMPDEKELKRRFGL